MLMPTPDAGVLSRRNAIARDLRRLLSRDQVIADAEACKAYESDGLTAYAQAPLLVVLPADTEQVSRVLSYCSAQGIGVVPRGAGTSLSGGALPVQDGIVLGLGKLNRILEIDANNRCAVVQSGVTNLAVTRAVQHLGLHYAPDPSSQIACTIGGNIAENAGGVHCLKYGLTSNNLLGALFVLPDGEVLSLGGKQADSAGLDLLGVVAGSEGLLGVVTEAIVRLLPAPATARAILLGFSSCAAAGDCVSEIIGAGIIPSGLEMMDQFAVRAAEQFVHAGYPLDVAALLIVELDGCEPEIAAGLSQVLQIAERTGAVYRRCSHDEAERQAIWYRSHQARLRSTPRAQSGAHVRGNLELHANAFPSRAAAGPRRRRVGEDRPQLCALRLVHRDVSDLCVAGRRARQPARPHYSDQGHA
ncbi:MAG: glcD [Gammaproteobacteria bacterium]|nr:glcD [Gammaproteobacteria bacterium]